MLYEKHVATLTHIKVISVFFLLLYAKFVINFCDLQNKVNMEKSYERHLENFMTLDAVGSVDGMFTIKFTWPLKQFHFDM